MDAPSRIIVVGASAGGIEALIKVVGGLPESFSAAVFIVLHMAANSRSLLPKILSKHCLLPVRFLDANAVIEPGQVYVAPPDHHLLVKDGEVFITRGARENGHRPAIDPLFRSAAKAYGNRVIGVVLSGCQNDGTAGLIDIKRRGGIAIAQHPDDALFDSMPQSAIATELVDFVLPAVEIPARLAELAQKPLPDNGHAAADDPAPPDIVIETNSAELDLDDMRKLDRIGDRSPLTCPDCGGVLWEMNHDALVRYRCHVGHAYTAETLLEKQTDELEDALWAALRTLEEQVALSDRLAQKATERKQKHLAQRFHDRAEEADHKAKAIRRVLLSETHNRSITENLPSHREHGENSPKDPKVSLS